MPASSVPAAATRRYEVVHDKCFVRTEPNIGSPAVGVKAKGDAFACSEITVDGWVKLAGQAGWVVTNMRGAHGIGEVLRPTSSARMDLFVERYQPQGICCLEVVFKQVAIRTLPNRAAPPAGVLKKGEHIFARSQNFEGWVRVVHPSDSWVLGFAHDIGQLLRLRTVDDVQHLDLHALSEVWSLARKARPQLAEAEVNLLKDLEESSRLLAATDFDQVKYGNEDVVLADGLLTREDLKLPGEAIRRRLFAHTLVKQIAEDEALSALLPAFTLRNLCKPAEGQVSSVAMLEAAAGKPQSTGKLSDQVQDSAKRPTREAPPKTKPAAPSASDSAGWAAEGERLLAAAFFDTAAAAYSKALAVKDVEKDVELLQRCLRGRSMCWKQLHSFKALLLDAEQLLLHEGDVAEVHEWKMLACEGLERYEEALQEARTILLRNPGHQLANRKQHELGRLCRS